MLGIYAELLYYWPAKISHNHSDPEKEIRYRVGSARLALLKQFAEPLACYFDQTTGDQQAAYVLVHEDEADLHPDMPETTRVEYICGKKTPEGDYMIFSYQWFDSVKKAVSYAESHKMKTEKRWK